MPKKIIVFFGPPGSGKGTQADVLGQKMKLAVISPGELLRHEVDGGTEIGKKVAAKMAKGEMVSDAVIEKMLSNRISKPDCASGFILDGYPRKLNQLNYFKKRIQTMLVPGDKLMAIDIEVADDEVGSRIGGRRVCDCGASYHLKYNPPKKEGICDLCGAEITTRPDDKPEVLEERLKYYHTHIKPLLSYFNKLHDLVRINGNQDIKAVEADIDEAIKRL